MHSGRPRDLPAFHATSALTTTVLARAQVNFTGCHKITDTSLSELARRCTQLVTLSLRHCVEVSDVGVRLLSTLPRLKSIDLGHCLDVSDAGVTALREMPRLESLNLDRSKARGAARTAPQRRAAAGFPLYQIPACVAHPASHATAAARRLDHPLRSLTPASMP